MISRNMRLLLLLLAMGQVMSDEEQQPEVCAGGDYRCESKAAVQRLAEALASTLRDLATQELGAELAALGGAARAPLPPPAAALAAAIAGKLRRKLGAALRLLQPPLTAPPASYTRPCPYAALHGDLSFKTYLPFHNTTPVTEEEHDSMNELKISRQYYLSDSDYATDENCVSMAHSNLRYVYHRVMDPDPKLVVFIIDNSIDVLALQHAVDVVKEIAQALQVTDLFALKMTNTTDFVKFDDLCRADETSDVGNATDNNKLLLKEYVSTIDVAHTSVPLPIISEEITKLLSMSNLPQNKLIIFMTDSKVLTEDAWLNIFPNTEDENTKFAISMTDERDGDRNASAEVEVAEHWRHKPGVRLVRGARGARAGRLASALLGQLPRAPAPPAPPALLEPSWEAPARDFVVPLVRRGARGVHGLELYWSDLAEDLLYFRRTTPPRRAFVLDRAGRVVMHTHYPRPDLTTEKIKFAFLNSVENYHFIDSVKEQMLSKDKGTVTERDGASNETMSFTWESVHGLYVVCVAGAGDGAAAPGPPPPARANRDILFHRLDLQPPRGGPAALCRHFKQVATLEQATIYLSPSSFQSPFAYLAEAGDGPEALAYMQNYLAYLRSVAHGLLSNPGLAAGVRQDVGLLNTLAAYWRRAAQRARPRHVVRRYAAAASGALLAYPGALLPRDYEPARRDWFERAAAAPDRVALSPPRLDPAGAGYVVTLSLAPARSPLVLAADLPLGFLQRLLRRALPQCGARGMRCFLMNERGYLVSHPALLQPPAAAGPVEQHHVTHKESVIATDMLNHRGFVHKRLCAGAADRAAQRYYWFNVSARAVGSAAAGEPCGHYTAAGVPGTDLLVALVNGSCGAGAFCPCSMVDRLCLNCNRMEQAECECPCECAAAPDGCPAAPAPVPAPAPPPPCPPQPEPAPLAAHFFHEMADDLKPCFDFECETLGSHAACLGVVGCEWCRAAGGGGALPAPFCAPQPACFGGVLGAVTPYGGGAGRGGPPPPTWSAAGPAAACLVAAGLVGAVAAYCCRAGAAAGGRRALYAAAPREPWPEPTEAGGGAGAGAGGEDAGRERLLPAPVSPYRVVAGSRRARRGGSDHGYSTMTPHEDSEATGAGGEGAPLSDDTRSDASCPLARPTAPPARPAAPPPPPGATALPCGRLLAPVTVHRHMEAS